MWKEFCKEYIWVRKAGRSTRKDCKDRLRENMCMYYLINSLPLTSQLISIYCWHSVVTFFFFTDFTLASALESLLHVCLLLLLDDVATNRPQHPTDVWALAARGLAYMRSAFFILQVDYGALYLLMLFWFLQSFFNRQVYHNLKNRWHYFVSFFLNRPDLIVSTSTQDQWLIVKYKRETEKEIEGNGENTDTVW